MTWSRLKRLAGALLGTALLASCSSEGSDWINMFKAARSAWDSRDAPVGLDEAAAIPYATLGVRVDGAREQVLLLATDSNGERLWTSGSRVAVTTRHGRIVRTSGFGTDLSGFQVSQGEATDWSRPHDVTWNADFADLGFYSLPVRCTMAPAGRDPVTILGKTFDTVRIDETCRADRIDWTFTNSYWVSLQSGRVWKALQNVHPKGPVLEIELLRPPLSEG